MSDNVNREHGEFPRGSQPSREEIAEYLREIVETRLPLDDAKSLEAGVEDLEAWVDDLGDGADRLQAMAVRMIVRAARLKAMVRVLGQQGTGSEGSE